MFKCEFCDSKVNTNSEYSVHMNLKHRGKQYKEKQLNKGEGNKKHESNFRKPKTDVYNSMEE